MVVGVVVLIYFFKQPFYGLGALAQDKVPAWLAPIFLLNLFENSYQVVAASRAGRLVDIPDPLQDQQTVRHQVVHVPIDIFNVSFLSLLGGRQSFGLQGEDLGTHLAAGSLFGSRFGGGLCEQKLGDFFFDGLIGFTFDLSKLVFLILDVQIVSQLLFGSVCILRGRQLKLFVEKFLVD